ncbi:hypothetical protein [Serratia fonticola]
MNYGEKMRGLIILFALMLSGCVVNKKEPTHFNFGSPEPQPTDTSPITESDALPLSVDSNNRDPLSESNQSSYKYLIKKTSNNQSISNGNNVGSVTKSSPKLEVIQPKDGQTLEDSDRYLDQFYRCSRDSAIKYSKLNEPVESIAKASVTSCEKYIYKSMNANIYFLNSSVAGKEQAISKIKRNGYQIAIKSAMDAKLNSQG